MCAGPTTTKVNPLSNVLLDLLQDSLHGAPHLAEGPTLTLESVSRQDSGTYRCFADNGIREPVFVDLQLIVLCK